MTAGVLFFKSSALKRIHPFLNKIIPETTQAHIQQSSCDSCHYHHHFHLILFSSLNQFSDGWPGRPGSVGIRKRRRRSPKIIYKLVVNVETLKNVLTCAMGPVVMNHHNNNYYLSYLCLCFPSVFFFF